MAQHNSWSTLRSYTRDSSVKNRRVSRATFRRILGFARPYRALVAGFLVILVIEAVLGVAQPLLFKRIVDDGISVGNSTVVTVCALLVVVLALADAGLGLLGRLVSSRIGEGLIFDLRTRVYTHVQAQSVAFFTRAQTGALVSRLNNDVVGAQQAFTSTLSGLVGNLISVVVTLATMLWLSWQITIAALVLLPLFLLPARWMGRRLQALTREQMQLNAEMSTQMTERFNVAGALLVKLFGRPAEEDEVFAGRAGRVRDIGVRIAMANRYFFTALTLVAMLATALVYGVGGNLVINGTLTLGTLLALAALLGQLYGPLTALSNVRVDVMTALVSFERVFEVLDLPPLVAEPERPQPLPAGPVAVEFEHVAFRYPSVDEVSLASLESVARTTGRAVPQQVLHDVSFTAAPGQLVALVGPSGAGKTTITALVSRLYDVTAGAVRVGGVDVRDLSAASLQRTVGVVTQDAHMFHDTIRANLLYARPDATEAQLLAACRDAQVADLLAALPDGLDTVVGDRGYRLSGGEKQRLALARLLLKAPAVVVLDEATAHLDSESELAVQRALDTALTGRTSLVIAHRLSTIREADLILVVDDGEVVERGSHAQLLAHGGLYADLYRTQFAGQAASWPADQIDRVEPPSTASIEPVT
ncbi:MAG: ABC transporter ATP-binding protein [Actinomycetota bacterium]|nr:MAG: ABC transporter ATP-binding protein [Actinomycetota bacterium]